MKTRRPNDDHIQQPVAHTPQQIAPTFRSPRSIDRLTAAHAEVRDAIARHGRDAADARRAAEEQVQQVRSREQMIADKRQALEEFRAQTEREIASIGDEIDRHNATAKEHHDKAEMHVQAQQEAELQKSDLEDVLGAYAPGVLEMLYGGTPPAGLSAAGVPGNTVQSNGTGEYAIQVAGGTGPQQVPAPRQGR